MAMASQMQDHSFHCLHIPSHRQISNRDILLVACNHSSVDLFAREQSDVAK